MIKFSIATSYFYHIRFFKPYMIPISTAVWDPKWYHNFEDANHCYIDRNGVINGLRIDPLRPGSGCANLCRGVEQCTIKNPNSCGFIHYYTKQLDEIDFDKFMQQLENSVQRVCDILYLTSEPIVVFMFHEKYDNPCSERVPVQQWFKKHGIDVQELKYPIRDNYV